MTSKLPVRYHLFQLRWRRSMACGRRSCRDIRGSKSRKCVAGYQRFDACLDRLSEATSIRHFFYGGSRILSTMPTTTILVQQQ